MTYCMIQLDSKTSLAEVGQQEERASCHTTTPRSSTGHHPTTWQLGFDDFESHSIFSWQSKTSIYLPAYLGRCTLLLSLDDFDDGGNSITSIDLKIFRSSKSQQHRGHRRQPLGANPKLNSSLPGFPSTNEIYFFDVSSGRMLPALGSSASFFSTVMHALDPAYIHST